ncbi:MAG: prolyl oligopeptidase family serine peptidase [Ornithinimicrobium sp.]
MADQVQSPQGARLIWKNRPAHARAVVLVLHGGQARGTAPTSWWQASVVRVMPFARAIVRRGRRDVAVAFLKYAVRGWNGAGDPVLDARWALSEIEAAYGDLPLGLLGYSMGGRVALELAGECTPRALVTLSAWVEPSDVGRWRSCPSMTALLLHGSADRVTDPQGSELAAEALRRGGSAVEVEIVPGDTHAILKNARYWHRRAADFLITALCPN